MAILWIRSRVNVSIADDEWFWLKVNSGMNPMKVLHWTHEKGWKYLGPKFMGKHMYHVKLIRFGYVQNLEEARQKADKLGYRLVEGQAIRPFVRKFPRLNDNDVVAFGGSKWQNPSGVNRVVCYCYGSGSKGEMLWHWADNDFPYNFRWLVTEKDF